MFTYMKIEIFFFCKTILGDGSVIEFLYRFCGMKQKIVLQFFIFFI